MLDKNEDEEDYDHELARAIEASLHAGEDKNQD